MIALQHSELRGQLLFDEPMSRHCSWRAGGPARRFYRPADLADLEEFLRGLQPGEPLLWLGLGSNLLVRDGGFNGTVIALKGSLQHIALRGEHRVEVEAGVSCARFARFSARHGLTGAEFFAGIPGTIGGALRMNAGAFGGETWAHVVAVTTIGRDGHLRRRKPTDFEIGYRRTRGPSDEWFASAVFELQSGDAQLGQATIRQLLEKRSASQPTRWPSCGSVFRNPPNDHAARLIEQAGLKGVCIGDACVSELHANFIINTGQATARDIESLLQQVQETVERTSGIRLKPEVHIVGEMA